MASRKSAAKRRRRAVPVSGHDNLRGAYQGNDDEDSADGVAVVMREDVASVRPQSWDRLDEHVRQALGDAMLVVGRQRALGRELDEIVTHLREEHQVPWASIGWAVGLTAEGARQRWGSPGT